MRQHNERRNEYGAIGGGGIVSHASQQLSSTAYSPPHKIQTVKSFPHGGTGDLNTRSEERDRGRGSEEFVPKFQSLYDSEASRGVVRSHEGRRPPRSVGSLLSVLAVICGWSNWLGEGRGGCDDPPDIPANVEMRLRRTTAHNILQSAHSVHTAPSHCTLHMALHCTRHCTALLVVQCNAQCRTPPATHFTSAPRQDTPLSAMAGHPTEPETHGRTAGRAEHRHGRG